MFQVDLLHETLLKRVIEIIKGFFQLLFGCPMASHYRGGSLNHPIIITCVLNIQPEGHREPRSKVGSLSPAEYLLGFEPGAF